MIAALERQAWGRSISNANCVGIRGDVAINGLHVRGVEESKLFDSATKPSANAQQMTTDWAQCQADNTSDPSSGMSDAERAKAKQCMNAKGYGTIQKGL